MTLSAMLLSGHSMAIKYETFSIKKLIEDCIKCAQLACPGYVEYTVTIKAGIAAQIFSDQLCLSRNLVNLLSNAAKQTTAHRIPHTIRVVVSLRNFDRSVSSTDYDRGEMLEFAVVDTGTGIPEDMLETIFNPFFSATGSTGLGLYVVKRQCEAMGGVTLQRSAKPQI